MSADEWRALVGRVPELWVQLHVTKCRQDVMARQSGSASRGAPLAYRVDAAVVQAGIREVLQGALSAHDRAGAGVIRYRTIGDLVADALTHAAWIDRHEGSEEWRQRLADLIAEGWRAVDRPPDLVRLGLCDTIVASTGARCTAELWHEPDQEVVQCPVCGAVVQVRARRDANLARAAAFRAPLSVVVQTLSAAGVRVGLEQARNWTKRKDKHGRLMLAHVAVRDDGTRLYQLGDVVRASSRRRDESKAEQC